MLKKLPEKTYKKALVSLITTIIDTHCINKGEIDVCFIKAEILKACNINIADVPKRQLKYLVLRIWSVLRALKKENIIIAEAHKTSTTTNYYLITKP